MRKKYGMTIQPQPCLNRVIFGFIYVYICHDDGASFFFFFLNLLSLKCWYFECISRVHNVICSLKEVVLVTAQLFLYGNLYEIWTIRKKYVFSAKKRIVNANYSFLSLPECLSCC